MDKTKRELRIALILTLVLSFMDLSGLPSALFINISVADVEPFYFTLMINFILIGIVAYAVLKKFCPHWKLGIHTEGLKDGLMKYGLAGFITLVITLISFCIGLRPFDQHPSIWKVLIEGFIYYIGVGIIEELYVRGLLLNGLEKLLGARKNATFWAIMIASLIFGLGHIFGTLGSPLIVIISKVVWTVALGIYYGAVYKRTGNLCIVMILHIVMDFCAVPYCFSTQSTYPFVSLYIILPTYILLGIYGILIFRKEGDIKGNK